jgi:hypothetical protein
VILGPREGRVVFFEQFASSLAELPAKDSALASFLCGFLASQIGPGTLDYTSLLAPYLEHYPTAFLWYGLCSGLQNRSSLYGFASGLGRRILREVLRKETLSDSPQCDIALPELEALTSNDTAAMDFRTGTQGVLTIEIIPLVTTSVRWPQKQVEQPELFPTGPSTRDMRELMAQLDNLRSRIGQVQNNIVRILDDQESLEWKSDKRRKR